MSVSTRFPTRKQKAYASQNCCECSMAELTNVPMFSLKSQNQRLDGDKCTTLGGGLHNIYTFYLNTR